MSIPNFLDIEASGFGRGSYPIQIGVALSNGQVKRWLVRPEPEWTHWDWNAQRVHGIGRTLIEREGMPAIDVARELNLQLAGQRLFSDAWSNDNSWLGLLFDVADWVPRFQLDSLRTLLSESQAEVWHQTKEAVLKRTQCPKHDAGADAYVLRETYLTLTGAGQAASQQNAA